MENVNTVFWMHLLVSSLAGRVGSEKIDRWTSLAGVDQWIIANKTQKLAWNSTCICTCL